MLLIFKLTCLSSVSPLSVLPSVSMSRTAYTVGALHVTERKYLKRDWCKTQPLKQTIHEEGCNSRTIINRFCYGQCNSFYIPRHIRKEEGSFQSCSFCKPKKFTTMMVTLNCPELQPPTKKKRVTRVKQCRCISIDLD
ncbi:gremlin-1 isoform X3 [Enhydra lutris kenyoni]|uniref:Gremlin-1 n=1 Tax=Enhydra lutris kenyoni TaxID=391180 RepID=A0A2Y9IJX2_ENHLU|nr:gremlin-1 isoform X3 [Enhydra lutris kenyoni]